MAISFGKQNSKLKTYGYPNFMLDFAKTKSLLESIKKDTPITFTRASSVATYVGADGLIKRAATNLALYSEQFNNAWWGKGNLTVSANQIISPDGKQTADKIVPNTVSTGHYINRGQTYGSGTFTFSVYVKYAGHPRVGLRVYDGSAYRIRTTFDIQSGTVVLNEAGTPLIEDVGDGWFRVSVTGTSPSGNMGQTSGWVIESLPGNNTVQTTFAGDGTSGLYIWGAQLEEGSVATPYIKTTSTVCGAPRFDHDPVTGESLGLLVEEARTNYIPSSEDFASMTGVGVVAGGYNATTAPDGTQTADKITFNTTGYGSRYQLFATTTSANYSVSVFAKADTYDRLSIEFRGSAATPDAIFDLSSGTIVSGTGTIEDYGNGWFRCAIVKAAVDTQEIVIFGRGATGSINDSIFLWGAQLEQGSFPTSYIPTEGSAVQRTADIASVEGPDFSTTNLRSYSESFDVGWTMTGFDPVTVNATISPDGQMTADLLTPDSGVSNKRIYFSSATPNDNVFSFYAKSNGWQYIGSNPTNTNGGPVFDIINGTVARQGPSDRTASIESVGNGWYRCIINYLASAVNNYNIVFLDSNAAFYQGTSATGNGTDGAYLWGASLTATEYPVEYTTTRNLLTDSQDFERTSWVKSGVTVENNEIISPDGTLTAEKFTASTDVFGQQVSVPTGQTVTFSVYIKRGNNTWVRFGVWDASGGSPIGSHQFRAWANLQTKTLGTQSTVGNGVLVGASIEDVGNDWLRLKIAGSITGFQLYAPIVVSAPSDNNTGRENGAEWYLWGAQLEPGTTATEYVRTTDVVGKKYNWYEPTEGSALIDYDRFIPEANLSTESTGLMAFYPTGITGPVANTVSLWRNIARVVDETNTSSINDGLDYTGKYILGYKKGEMAGAANGSLTTSTGNVAIGVDSMTIGFATTYYLNGHIKRLLYWNTRKADSVLQGLTSGSWE